MTNKARFRIAFVLIAGALAFARGTARGWSSTVGTSNLGIIRLTTGAFATHQYLTQRARQLLGEHPVLRAGFVRFPDADTIVRHGSIDQGQNGLGPDNPGNSLYSWHWYNPSLEYERGSGNGLAPKKVAEYFLGLKNLFKLPGQKGGSPSVPPGGSAARPDAALPDGAHEAAYLAHFIQDMTCAFHIVGMPIPPLSDPGPIRLYRNDPVKKLMIGGPFRTFTEDDWDDVVGHAAVAYAADRKADWFDPNYYDGKWPADVKDSGHFQYEAMVEVAYMKDVLNHTRRWDSLLAAGLVSPVWRRAVPAEEFARLVARATLSKYITAGADLFSPEMRSKGLVEIPYDDWWKAIQATYTLWRQSFSALVVLADDLKLVKLPNEEDMYQLQAVVRNLEPEADATQVSVAYEIPGAQNQKGKGTVSKIALSGSSEWISLSGKVRISDPEIRGNEITYNGPGTIRLEVTGEFPLPDAEEVFREFPLRDIRIVGKILPDMTGWKRAEVEDYLRTNDLRLAPGKNAGPAPTPGQEDTVESQRPRPRAIVAPGDAIEVSLYGRFLVKVPNVTSPAVLSQEAVRKIKAAGLIAEEPIREVEVDPEVPEGVAVDQDPKPDTLVPPGSSVRFLVSVHRRAAAPAPAGRLNCYASIDIEPQNPYITVDERIKLQASVAFYDAPYGGERVHVPLSRVRFEWKIETQKKEDWPPGDVVVMSAEGPVATLTPVAAGLVQVTCRVANVLNQNLAGNQVIVVKSKPPVTNPPADAAQAAAPPPARNQNAAENRRDPPPPAVKPPPDPVPPAVPAEDSTELEGVWDTTRGIVISVRRIGGNDYKGTLARLYTEEKIKYYKVPVGYVMFRARRTAPGTYTCDFMGGIHPKTGEMWYNDYIVLTVKGNAAKVRGGLTWLRVER